MWKYLQTFRAKGSGKEAKILVQEFIYRDTTNVESEM